MLNARGLGKLAIACEITRAKSRADGYPGRGTIVVSKLKTEIHQSISDNRILKGAVRLSVAQLHQVLSLDTGCMTQILVLRLGNLLISLVIYIVVTLCGVQTHKIQRTVLEIRAAPSVCAVGLSKARTLRLHVISAYYPTNRRLLRPPAHSNLSGAGQAANPCTLPRPARTYLFPTCPHSCRLLQIYYIAQL
ncbi:hypothetical protein EDC01DRAFT_305923 [Geopyxis carbonaria]|nr:hypothetical protein EDC01DRAFT_305923 [Geopyxis carbonaria]